MLRLAECIKLVELTFGTPSSLRQIGKAAFSGCSAIQSVYISSSVEIIESDAFMSCSSLAVAGFAPQ
jgi:hypothetical protein